MLPDRHGGRLARHRKPAREIIAPGALRIPDEVPVTVNWGPRVGTARLSADGRGVVADIAFDHPAGSRAADAILTGRVGGMSFQVEHAEAAVIPASTAPLGDPGGQTWQIVSGHRHRHAERNRSELVGWREHDHLGGGVPHRHDPQTGAQIPVGCDPDTCRFPSGSHAPTCRL